jgi:polysaccharide export outer membrane protein
MIKRYSTNFFLVLLISISSCSSYHNSMLFQGVNRNPDLKHKIGNYTPIIIQTGDVIGLNVKSLSPEGSAIFNTGGNASNITISTDNSSSGASSQSAEEGYTVDQNGEIQLPLVHNIKVKGLTIVEAQNTIQKAITLFLKEPIVIIHLVNFKITVVGDVGHPGIFSVSSDHISITQMLGLAGDLTASSKRNNILLIREIDGERKFVNIDMTSAQLFDSPFYYLKNNDMLYVEEGRGKFTTPTGYSKIAPIILSGMSLLFLVVELRRYKVL